jgi:hypothetical protein
MQIAALLLLAFKQKNEESNQQEKPAGQKSHAGQREEEQKNSERPAGQEKAKAAEKEAQESESKAQESESKKPEEAKGKETQKGPRQRTIENEQNAKWYQDLGKRLAGYWRIGIHWLQVLRDNLCRPCDSRVFASLAGCSQSST